MRVAIFSKHIFEMSKCDIVVFTYGWDKDPYCRLIDDIARHFGIETQYLDKSITCMNNATKPIDEGVQV